MTDPMADYHRQFGDFLGKLTEQMTVPKPDYRLATLTAPKPVIARITEKVADARCRGNEWADLSGITDSELAAEVNQYCDLRDETMDVVDAAILAEAARRLGAKR